MGPVHINCVSVPYTGWIEGGIYPGRSIRILGTVPPSPDRFVVNLQCGSATETNCDIALHLSCRFDERVIVRNSFQQKSWGPEERFGGMPLLRRQNFDMKILCEADCYKISVNGQHFTEYPHRMSLQCIKYLAIHGDVVIGMISYEGSSSSFTDLNMDLLSLSCPETPAPLLSVSVPYTGWIEGGIYPGRSIRILGTVPPNPDRFVVNLQCGSATETNCDIALHLSCRFNERAIFRNSFQRKSWGPEENFGGMPLLKGQNFEMKILCKPDHYQISVDGQLFAQYTHRMSHQCVKYLAIYGDVAIGMITYEGIKSSFTGVKKYPEIPIPAPKKHEPPAPLLSVSVPYDGPIQDGVFPGRIIRILGTVPPNANRFDVNLQCGSGMEPNCDIALHLSCRFKPLGKKIVRNSYQRNSWGHEEISGGMPLSCGGNFELQILCDPHHYKISVNGQLFTEFTHRMSHRLVKYLAIVGDVAIGMISYEGSSPPIKASCDSGPASPLLSVAVPYDDSIPGGIYPGKSVRILGTVPPNADRFAVKLQCGPGMEPRNGVALQLSCRFGQRAIVRNSYQRMRWGPEETSGGFPLSRGQNFELTVQCDTDFYKISVNGQLFTEFTHRISYDLVRNLAIHGNVAIGMITYEEKGGNVPRRQRTQGAQSRGFEKRYSHHW